MGRIEIKIELSTIMTYTLSPEASHRGERVSPGHGGSSVCVKVRPSELPLVD
jgi:hypothetical protein